MAAQEAKEDVKSSIRLLYDISAQMVSFGPVLAAKMSIYSSLNLPWGLGAAGAETVKRGVDSDNAEGISTMTACMVRLGLLGTVHDIVVSLCEQDRADAVAAVTAGLLSQGEVVIVTRITNALVASGHSDHATTISGHLISQGNTQIYEVVKEAGLNMGLLSGDSGGDKKEDHSNDTDKKEDDSNQPSSSGSGFVEGIQKQGAQLLEKVTPTENKQPEQIGDGKKRKSAASSDEAGDPKHGKTQHGIPDADALFGDWSGAKKTLGIGRSDPDSQNKEDKLL